MTRDTWRVTYLLLNVLRHARGVLGETFGVDHAIEGVCGEGEGEGDVLAVAQHPDIQHDVVFWNEEHYAPHGIMTHPSPRLLLAWRNCAKSPCIVVSVEG